MTENANNDKWVIVRKYPEPLVEVILLEKVDLNEYCFWRINEDTNRSEYVRKGYLDFWNGKGI